MNFVPTLYGRIFENLTFCETLLAPTFFNNTGEAKILPSILKHPDCEITAIFDPVHPDRPFLMDYLVFKEPISLFWFRESVKGDPEGNPVFTYNRFSMGSKFNSP